MHPRLYGPDQPRIGHGEGQRYPRVQLARCREWLGSDTDRVRLFSQGFPPEEVFIHPRHEAAQKALPDLIRQLRAAANVKDSYEFQQELITHVRETEEARNAFSQAVKRLEDGKSPQSDVPEPQSNGDPSLVESWRFERDICERVARQFRCAGDALAWRVFGFERRNIIALCQNAPPGVWADKAGVPAELDAVEEAYRQDGQFAILHDMTNCLRIGDVTIFRNDGSRCGGAGDSAGHLSPHRRPGR